MKRICIYTDSRLKKLVLTKDFDEPSELKPLLDEYEGYWSLAINLKTDVILEGAFDDTFLDEDYYN